MLSRSFCLSPRVNYPDADADHDGLCLYAFFRHVEIQQKVTTLPTVPSGQNGDANTYTITETIDIQGRPTQKYDPLVSGSSLTTAASTLWNYDEPTGAVIQSIRNPNTGSPNWENVLTTDFVVDLSGRTIQTLGPAFSFSLLPPGEGQGEGASASGALVQARRLLDLFFATSSMKSGRPRATLRGARPRNTSSRCKTPFQSRKMDHDGRTIDSIQAVRLPSGFLTGNAVLRRPAP